MTAQERHAAIIAAQELERYARQLYRALQAHDDYEAVWKLRQIRDFSTDVLSFTPVISADAEAPAPHVFAPTEFGGDTCERCGRDLRHLSHVRLSQPPSPGHRGEHD